MGEEGCGCKVQGEEVLDGGVLGEEAEGDEAGVQDGQQVADELHALGRDKPSCRDRTSGQLEAGGGASFSLLLSTLAGTTVELSLSLTAGLLALGHLLEGSVGQAAEDRLMARTAKAAKLLR